MTDWTITPEVTTKIAHWLCSGDTGVSSETIATIALGAKGGRFDVPYDSGDFGRCYRLVKAIPELIDAFPLVVERCPEWGPIIAEWDGLCAMYERDLATTPEYEMVSRGRGRPRYRRQINARECCDRIYELRDACRIAGGWVQVSPGCWQRNKP